MVGGLQALAMMLQQQQQQPPMPEAFPPGVPVDFGGPMSGMPPSSYPPASSRSLHSRLSLTLRFWISAYRPRSWQSASGTFLQQCPEPGHHGHTDNLLFTCTRRSRPSQTGRNKGASCLLATLLGRQT